MNWRKLLMPGLLGAATMAAAAAPPPATQSPAGDELYEAGRQLFDDFAPAEIKQQFDFPTREQWDGFAAHLQAALAGNRLEDLAAYEPQARAVLAAFELAPGYEDDTAWLKERLDYIEAAKQAVQNPPATDRSAANRTVPHYALWLRRLQARPVPAAAAARLPQLREVFAAAGLPPALVWLAEVESGFNPAARSPAGARGLFQLMPGTARELGLSASFPDDRSDPRKNAAAAAKYLRLLFDRFHDWPLTLAAYNAGPGRVEHDLGQRPTRSYAEIASLLPAETRMYVPKVLATLAVRAAVGPGDLGPPR